VWSLDLKIEWLVKDLIPLGAMMLLSAASGTGKTRLAYSIAGAVARGVPFLGRASTQRPALYLDTENSGALVKEILVGHGVPETPALNVWGGWVRGAVPGPDAPEIVEYAERYKPLLIFDSLIAFHPGDEQSASDTREYMDRYPNNSKQLKQSGTPQS
jgi:RecA-family ATPase